MPQAPLKELRALPRVGPDPKLISGATSQGRKRAALKSGASRGGRRREAVANPREGMTPNVETGKKINLFKYAETILFKCIHKHYSCYHCYYSLALFKNFD